jgi:hypothetical protein
VGALVLRGPRREVERAQRLGAINRLAAVNGGRHLVTAQTQVTPAGNRRVGVREVLLCCLRARQTDGAAHGGRRCAVEAARGSGALERFSRHDDGEEIKRGARRQIHQHNCNASGWHSSERRGGGLRNSKQAHTREPHDTARAQWSNGTGPHTTNTNESTLQPQYTIDHTANACLERGLRLSSQWRRP